MYKSPSRNHRPKGGFKMKHILQICILVAVCFWLIYQVKRSHEKKQEFDEKDGRLMTERETSREMLKLGRKDIPRINDDGEDEEDNEGEEDGELNKMKEKEEDEEEDMSRGGGGIDDEINEREQEKTNEETESEGEAEEEHGEKEEENENEGEGEDKSIDNEAGDNEDARHSNGTEMEDKDNEAGDGNTKEAREENYKADDASSEVTHEAANSTLEHTNDILQPNNSDIESLTRSSDRDGEVTANSSNSTYTDELKSKDSPFVFEDTSSDNSTTLSESHLVKKFASARSQNSTNTDETKDKDHTIKLEDSSAQNSILPSEPKVPNSQSQLDNNWNSEKSQNAKILPDETHIPSNLTDAQNTVGESKPVDENSNSHIQMITQTNSSELASDEEQFASKSVASNNTRTEDVKLDDSDQNSNGEDPDEESDKSNEKTGKDESNDESQGAEDEENGGTNGDFEGFDSSQAEKENADPEQHDDPIDDSDSSLTQEEKDTRTDLDTLPEIATEGQSTEVAEAE